MGLPFIIVEGAILITDENGRIAEITDTKRLKVEAELAEDGNIIPTLGTNLRYEEMNQKARGSTINNTWHLLHDIPNAAGILIGFLITVEDVTKEWRVRLVIDGVEVFGSNGISFKDLQNKNIFGFDRSPRDVTLEWLGFEIRENTFRYEGPVNLPLKYKDSIKIYLKKVDGNKKFRAGLLSRTEI